jgi:hypothetical protein
MTQQSKRLVVFEDNQQNYDLLLGTLGPIAEARGCAVQRHEPGKTKVAELFSTAAPPSLVVLDWDLTKYADGTARELVRGTCLERMLPLCTYQSIVGGHGEARRLLRWNDNEIAIDSSNQHPEIGKLCGAILGGFLDLESAFQEGRPLGETVRGALKAPPEVEIQLEQYTWGEQRFLQVTDSKSDRPRFMATAIGYWIYNQLLQFPGLLLDLTAAASYLDVDTATLGSSAAQAVFERAKYNGPFSDAGLFWWANGLETVCSDLMETTDDRVPSGRQILGRRSIPTAPARCIKGHDGAGYYCIITKKAVCAEHSVQPRGWMPIGADRCRIETDTYEEVSAWLEI